MKAKRPKTQESKPTAHFPDFALLKDFGHALDDEEREHDAANVPTLDELLLLLQR